MNPEGVRFQRCTGLEGVEAFSYDGHAQHLPRHAHAEHQLTLYSDVVHRVGARGLSAVGAPGTAMILQAGEPHSSEPVTTQRVRLHGIYFAESVVKDVAETLWTGDGTVCFGQMLISDPALIAELANAHRAVIGGDAGADERFITAIAQLLERCAEPTGGERQLPAAAYRIDRVRSYLVAHVEDEVTLDELAVVAGLSRYHMIRAFRESFHVTPFAYLRRLRIERSREVLARGGDLGEAVAAGKFADQSHLGRMFRAHYGVSPGRYRLGFGHVRAVRSRG